MALTAAERSKRYRERIKQDPEKHELYKKKELKRLKKHFKKINELTEEEKDARRKRWREQKRCQKEKKMKPLGQEVAAARKQSAPVEQQSAVASNAVPRLVKIKLNQLNNNYKAALNNIDKYKTALNNIRKKLYRARKQHEKEMHLLQTENEKLKARQEVMEVTLREVYTDCKKNPEKRVIKSIALKIGEKMNTKPERNFLGLKSQVRKTKFQNKPFNNRIVEDLEKFYNRDDVSRSTAGKRETRTKNKRKVQIRYLIDTMQNLYKIYKNEGGKYSFTTFFRYKPYYILSPSATTRNTCMCIKHSNMEFMVNALKLKGVIQYKGTKEILNEIACDTKSFKCMYNKCNQCKIIKIQYNKEKLQDDVAWFKWGRVVHKYIKSGQEMLTKKTTKQQIKGTILDLITELKKELPAFKTHCFNWIEQQRQYRACVTNMKEEEIGILCDFSENYECKYSQEIQSMHFGASKNSISLHCGVIFGTERSQSFVTVSDVNCHEPHAIWAHLMPVLKLAKEKFPNTKIIHFFSDGPSTQYRQKKNFYLLNLFTHKLKLAYSTWSFSEAGHGKSMADGIGGSVKRQLDKRLSYGYDITNATEACHVLQNTMKSVKCFYISDSDIKNLKKLIPDGLRAVPGTMQLHQIICTQDHEIQYRELSCFCGEMRGLCSCYHPKTHLLMDKLNSFTAVPVIGDTINEPSILSLDFCAHPEPPIVLNAESLTSLFHTDFEYPINSLLTTAVDEQDITYYNENIIIDSYDTQNLETEILLMSTKSEEHLPILMDERPTFEVPKNPIVISPKHSTFNTDLPTIVKRVHKPFDNDPVQLTPHSKRVKVLKPLNEPYENKANKKTIKILHEKVENENLKKRKSITSSRTFPCHVCKTRQCFILQHMAKCMVCNKWVCISCSGTTSFDFICNVCLGDEH